MIYNYKGIVFTFDWQLMPDLKEEDMPMIKNNATWFKAQPNLQLFGLNSMMEYSICMMIIQVFL